MRDSLDAAQSFWQNQVVNFNEDKQIDLFNFLGISSLKKGVIGILVIILSLILILLIFFFLEKKKQSPKDPLSLAAYKLLKRLENKGMGKYDFESFSAFLRRIAKEKNLLNQEEFFKTALFYEDLRFREKGNLDEAISAMKKLKVAKIHLSQQHKETI